MKKKAPRISLCMIARNEAHIIAQAVTSVASLVDEVIIVDTGSTDETKEVAKRLGCTVYERPWDDDFAAPRNLSLAKATGDWILVLDADEAIAASDLPKLRDHTKTKGACFELTQRHYSNNHCLSDYVSAKGEYPEWERSYLGYFASSLVRFFPNNEGILYEGRIHELVEPSIGRLKRHRIVRSPVPIHHYGHTPEELQRKNKHSLYGQLGQEKLRDNPTDWKGYYELGVELNRPDKREESVLAFKESIKRNPSYVSTWVNLGYVLCELGRLTEAKSTLTSAIQLDGQSHEAYCNLGVVYMRGGDFARAEACLKQAARINPNYVNAYMNLASALVGLSRLSEAVFYLNRVLELAPRHARAKADLGAVYLIGGLKAEADRMLRNAVKEDPTLEDAVNNLRIAQAAEIPAANQARSR